MTRPLLEVEDGARGHLWVDDASATVLLGPSGAGKSTWIAWLLGLRGPPPDRLEMGGAEITSEVLRRRVGWVPQTDGVFLSGTVWDNVRRPVRDHRATDETARDVLDLLGLVDRVNDPCIALSRGERRRVALARALARRVHLLVIDDPLDRTVTTFWDGVLDQAPGGGPRGVLTATATADAHARSHERVALVDRGRVVTCASWAAVRQSRDPDVRGVLTWVDPF